MDNDTILTNISKLGSMSTAIGCEAMRQLETESGKSKEVYAHLDKLFTLLDDRNPYARTRAFVLIAKNVSWDSRKKIDRNIDRLLKTVDAEQATPVSAAHSGRKARTQTEDSRGSARDKPRKIPRAYAQHTH